MTHLSKKDAEKRSLVRVLAFSLPAPYPKIPRRRRVVSCRHTDFIRETGDCKSVVVWPGTTMDVGGLGYRSQEQADYKSTRFISGKIQMKVSDFTFNTEGLLMGEFDSQPRCGLSLQHTQDLKGRSQSQARLNQQPLITAVQCPAQNSRSPDSIGHREIHPDSPVFPPLVGFLVSHRDPPPCHGSFLAGLFSQLTRIFRRSQPPVRPKSTVWSHRHTAVRFDTWM